MVNQAVKITDLKKTFNDRVVLDSISFSIDEGAITGFVGPDGAGKTTLIRLIMGLLLPDSGRVEVLGFNAGVDEQKISPLVGYMPQKFGLYEDLSVIENLNLYAELRELPPEKKGGVFDELLRFTNLTNFTKRLAGNLSGGMKQKLGLACSLIGKPKLLLLDEPGVGVDPIARRELWHIVDNLAKEGMCILWSTSYLDEAEACNKVLLLNEGKLLYDGIPRDLTNKISGRVFQLQNIKGNKRKILKNILRRKNVTDGEIQGDNIRFVVSEENQIVDISTLEAGEEVLIKSVKPRFEDVFVDMLGGGPGGDSVLADRLEAFKEQREFVIEADKLTKKFGSFTAANEITFKIRAGEIFGLLGPNGAGKSTTFKMMCGLLSPTCGTARVLGMDLQKASGKARSNIGYMAQKFSLYGNLGVKQNLSFFSGIYGLQGKIKKKKIDEMVEIFGFKDYLNTNADDLPLGYKQRLALSCAIMHNPEILFLDEPTSGIDPITRREFWTHINNIVEKGITVMVTTHFMDEAEYCDRISLIYRGKLIATGTPDGLRNQVKSPELTDPTMEDAFIALIKQFDIKRAC